MILLDQVIGAILELGVQKPIEASVRKAKHSESVVRILKKLKLEGKPTPDDFDSIYIYSLIKFGVFKPEPILNFFRNAFIYEAFRKSFVTIQV